MKKAIITVELVPEATEVADEVIKREIKAEAEIPWVARIVEVKVVEG